MRMNATNQTSDAGFRSLPWRLLLLLGLAAGSLVLASPSPAAAAGAVGNSPDAGFISSLALDAAGNPVVSYAGIGGDLKLLHCDNPDCTGGGESIEVVASNAGLSTSLALDGSGNPVIAYYTGVGSNQLRVTHCNDVNCSGGDESTVSLGAVSAIFCCLSLALDASGNPVVAYHAEFPGFQLHLLHCGNPNCTAGNSFELPDSTASGLYASLALDASGNPVVSYAHIDGNGEGLKVLHCNDPDCSGGDDSAVVVDPGEGFAWTSLRLDAAGNPVISYYDGLSGNLMLAHCNDPDCAGDNESIQAPDTDDNVGVSNSLALDAAGNPVISYCLTTGPATISCDDLIVMHCNDANCAGGNENIQTADEFGGTGSYTSLELDAAGNPVISYSCVNSPPNIPDQCPALKVLHCTDAKCAAEPVGGVAELAPVAGEALEAAGSRGPSTGAVLGVVALVAAAFVAAGAAVWQAKRR